jgi:hypothetical protein
MWGTMLFYPKGIGFASKKFGVIMPEVGRG